jgi:hypothetical protein
MTALINASTSSGLITTGDTSGSLALQSNGTTQFTVSSTGVYGQLKSATAQASTSGTSIDFTSIPSWVKRITVMFSGVSTNGTSIVQVQLGYSGGIETTGYASTVWVWNASGNQAAATSGIITATASGTTYSRVGNLIITNISGNTWIASGTIGYDTTGGGASMVSTKTISGGTLDRIRITTVNGTDTFDAGSINIMYEG